MEITSVPNRFQISIGRGGANATVNGHALLPKTFLLIAVVIRGERIAGFLARIDKRLIQGVQSHVVTATNPNRTIATAVTISAMMPSFKSFVVRQTGSVVPAHRTLCFPFINIAGMPAHESHAID